MTSSSLLISLLWHACLTLASANNAAPCPAERVQSATLPASYLPAAFTPTGEMRYDIADFPLAVYHVGEPPVGLSQSDVDFAILLALEAWNDVPCSSAQMIYKGHVPTPEDVPVDDALLITHRTESESPCLIAGDTSRIGTAPCVVGARNFRAAVFNRDQMRWYSIAREGQVRHWEDGELPWIDFRAALTHEVGHLLGLAHPSDGVHTPRASMFASYRIDGGQAHLAATDRAHLCALYPAEEVGKTTCNSDEGCTHAIDDPEARCVQLDAWRVCDKGRGLLGYYCADNMLNCEDLCLITYEQARTGYCTMRCTDDASCGKQGWVCDPEGLAAADPAERAVCVPAPYEPEPGCQHVPSSHTGRDVVMWLVMLAAMCGVARRRRELRTP